MRFIRSFGVALALALRLAAQEDSISADRPGFANGPDLVKAGQFQLEFGVNVEDDDGDSTLNLPTLLRYGLTERFELQFSSDVWQRSEGEEEFAPFAAGFKLGLREGDVPLTILTTVTFPSGGGSLQTDDFAAEIDLLSSLDIGGGFGFTPNIGVAFAESSDATLVVAATIDTEIGNTQPFIDMQMQAGDGDTSAIFDTGIAWTPNADTQLDVSGGIRLTGSGYPDWFVSAGYSRRF